MNNIRIPRLHSIDALRGLAVLFMILFHFMFSVDFFYGYQINLLDNRYFELLANIVRFIFLFLVGISTRIIYLNSVDMNILLKKQSVRIFYLSLSAFLVSLSTYFITDLFIFWGVLHLVTFSLLIFSLSFYRKYLVLFLLGFSLLASKYDFALQILGFSPLKYSTLDFFPIFPWLVIVYFGYILFDYLLPFIKNIESVLPNLFFLTAIGKNSLIIYLVHQPIILALLLIIKKLI